MCIFNAVRRDLSFTGRYTIPLSAQLDPSDSISMSKSFKLSMLEADRAIRMHSIAGLLYRAMVNIRNKHYSLFVVLEKRLLAGIVSRYGSQSALGVLFVQGSCLFYLNFILWFDKGRASMSMTDVMQCEQSPVICCAVGIISHGVTGRLINRAERLVFTAKGSRTGYTDIRLLRMEIIMGASS